MTPVSDIRAFQHAASSNQDHMLFVDTRNGKQEELGSFRNTVGKRMVVWLRANIRLGRGSSRQKNDINQAYERLISAVRTSQHRPDENELEKVRGLLADGQRAGKPLTSRKVGQVLAEINQTNPKHVLGNRAMAKHCADPDYLNSMIDQIGAKMPVLGKRTDVQSLVAGQDKEALSEKIHARVTSADDNGRSAITRDTATGIVQEEIEQLLSGYETTLSGLSVQAEGENILHKLEPGTKAKKAPSPARLAELAKTEWATLYDDVAAGRVDVEDIEEEPAPPRRAPPGAARQDAPATGVDQASAPVGLGALQPTAVATVPQAGLNAGVAAEVPTDFRQIEMHVQVAPPRDLATLNDLKEADRVIGETDGYKRFARDEQTGLINTETNHLLREVRETMARPAAGAAQLHADNLADLGLPKGKLADRIVDKDSGLVATIIVDKETKTVNIGFGGTGYGRLETEAASPNETPRALKRRNRKLVLSQWVTNVKMVLGITPRSFKQGEFITRTVAQRMKSNPDLKDYSLRLTGQSSGATTACYAALMQDKMPRTTLFGDPGLSTRLIRNTNPANWSKAPAMISSYRVEGDMYEWVGRLPGVKRVGTTADLPASPEVDQMYPNRHGNYDLHLDAYIKGVESQPSTEHPSTEQEEGDVTTG